MDWIDLLELQARLKEGIEETVPEKLWVRAEIASVQARANGHCYLELAQSDDSGIVAKARAVIWRSRYSMLSAFFHEATGSDLKAGMVVLFRVQVNYSELFGLTLVIDDLDPELTLGEAELRRRRTIEKLQEEDLIDRQKELAVSPLPYRLAVISARDAAGFGDFCRHLKENEYGFVYSVELFEASMQGETAPDSIIGALECIDAAGGFDAVLIMRGGGSVLDLSCFDDYGLCRAIAEFQLPVFTAIGHDRDHHVADMVAYDSVKTPTALADLFIDAFSAEDERISSYQTRLHLAFTSHISAMEARIDALDLRIRGAADRRMELMEMRLGLLEARIRAADPRTILSRGWSLVADGDGKVVKSSRKFVKGDKIRIVFADGTVDATVDAVSPAQSKN